jgi:hypothetical protein
MTTGVLNPSTCPAHVVNSGYVKVFAFALF